MATLCGVTLALLAAAGSAASRPAARATLVRVTERDFHIAAPKTVSAGDFRIRIKNEGPDTHELFVARTDDGRLPLRSDGLTVSEETLEPDIVGSVDGEHPGTVHELHLHLAPGRYVLFCNMFGHYMGGMHTELVVR
jgi:uncharacterized cupredoxin-like copper-binding protein